MAPMTISGRRCLFSGPILKLRVAIASIVLLVVAARSRNVGSEELGAL
jgi:hypothetical protein